ncbi:MAG: [Fe-Fe] hydrogenase large subunit C-terminal domain-containing protein, partial [Oscillospiraceae bacterium]
QTQKNKQKIKSGRKVIDSVAQTCITLPGVTSFIDYETLLSKLGVEAQETARGAFVVKSEYEKILKATANRPVVSSCCPVIIKYAEKHYPEALPFFAPVISPMEAHARLIKKEHPDAFVIFIGPCIAKKDDIFIKDSEVDAVLTFEEVAQWLSQEKIDAHKILSSVTQEDDKKYLSRVFPIAGGIVKSMVKQDGKKYLFLDGIENAKTAISELASGRLDNCFIEMSACEGGCIGGPSMQKNGLLKLSSVLKVKDYAIDLAKTDQNDIFTKDFNEKYTINTKAKFKNKKTFYSTPSEEQLSEIYKKMGKFKKEDFLNCGTCGYSSCREKAIAIYTGKAEIDMCLPFMKNKAKSIADKIINATPNAIITTGIDLKVEQINTAACEIFGIRSEDIIGSPVSRILDEYDFVNFIASGENTFNKKSFFAEYNIYLDQTFILEKAAGIIICMMKDITANKRRHDAAMKSKINAANMADDIVEKQLRIVHEIASLLGETAAETKIAVTDLKQAILDEEDI